MPRLFVVTWPPPEVMAVLSGFERPELPGVRWSVPAQWMVSIRPLGYVDARLQQPLIEVLEAELDGAPPPVCVIGPRTIRLGGQWLGAPVQGLDDLGTVIFETTEELVPVTHPQPFSANVVLARGQVPKHLAGQSIEAQWTARSVALVADRSAPKAPRYENLTEICLDA